MAAISAASAGAFFNCTANRAAASPVPPKIVLAAIPCRINIVISCLNSAVVPGNLSPRLVANASIWANSAGTLPNLSIMATRNSIAALSAWAYSRIGTDIAAPIPAAPIAAFPAIPEALSRMAFAPSTRCCARPNFSCAARRRSILAVAAS